MVLWLANGEVKAAVVASLWPAPWSGCPSCRQRQMWEGGLKEKRELGVYGSIPLFQHVTILPPQGMPGQTNNKN